ncbi:MAG: ABC transporter permease [Saprospiraceae bacterium]|nr:ABC transporter permease [Saprospiraceae bacterium]
MMRGPTYKWKLHVRATGFWIALAMCGMFLLAIFADFIANDRPLYARINGQNHWPVLESLTGQGTTQDTLNYSIAEVLILPLIPFSTDPSEGLNRYEPPLTSSLKYGRNVYHLLGTDRIGRDVAACMVYGFRKSLLVALFAMFIAGCLGVTIGMLAGYWGNAARIRRTWPFIVWLLFCLYAGFLFANDLVAGWIWILCLSLLLLLLPFVLSRSTKGHGVRMPLDDAVLKSIELFHAVPALMILLALTALLSNPTLWQLAVIIGLLKWTTVARFMRGEVLNIRNLPYVQAARISGLSHVKIMLQYILPQALGPLLVIFAFGIASVVLLESTLSFLGIGVPPEEITWGKLLSQAKSNTKAWWLAIFPGLTIFLLITLLQLSGDEIKRNLNPQD